MLTGRIDRSALSSAISSPFVHRSLVVIAVGVLARAFFVLWSAFYAGDSFAYEAIAVNILSGHGFAIVPESPTVFRPPVYPLFVAAVYGTLGHVPGYVFMLQAFVGGASMWLLYLLGRRLLPERVAFGGSVAAAAYPHLAWYAATFITETVDVFLLTAALLIASHLRLPAIDVRRTVALGTVLGILALSAPRFSAIPAALGILWLIQGTRLRRVVATLAVAAAGYGAVLAPWVIRNLVTFGIAVPLVVGMQSLVYWLPAYKVGLYDYRYDVWAKDQPLMARYVELYQGPGLAREREELPQHIQLEADLYVDTWRKIAADPGGYLSHQLRLVPYLWIQPAAYAGLFRPPFETQNDNMESMIARRHWGSIAARVASTMVFTVGLYAGVVLGLVALRRRLRAIGLLLLPAAYIAVLHTLAYVEHRFSVPSHPFLWLVSAAGWTWAAGLVAPRLSALRGGARRPLRAG